MYHNILHKGNNAIRIYPDYLNAGIIKNRLINIFNKNIYCIIFTFFNTLWS